MKEYLRSLIRNTPTPDLARNLVREYLQARILESLQRSGAMTTIAFHGGTALRFLYAIPRYSEDLDFALEQNQSRYDFRGYLQQIRNDLSIQAYQVEVRVNDQKTVHSAFVRLPGLLHELSLSPHASEVLAVKLEIDTNPPAGAQLATTLIRRHVTLSLQHHDPSSLLAGKLHAVLQRSYVKGRDLFDLFWYLSDPTWSAPNLVMLNQALQQSGWQGGEITLENWRVVLHNRLSAIAWQTVLADVRPFLEPTFDIHLLTKENLLRLVSTK